VFLLFFLPFFLPLSRKERKKKAEKRSAFIAGDRCFVSARAAKLIDARAIRQHARYVTDENVPLHTR